MTKDLPSFVCPLYMITWTGLLTLSAEHVMKVKV